MAKIGSRLHRAQLGIAVLLGVAALLFVAWALVWALPASEIAPFSGVLSGLAALAVAALTVVLLILNRQLAVATVAMAKATEAEARASNDTIAEIQRDRELTYRPHLVFRLDIRQRNQEPIDASATFVNFGRGPCLYSLCCAFWPDRPQLMTSILFTAGPGDEGQQELARRQGPIPNEAVLGRQLVEPRQVAFCYDMLGNSYRFLPYRPQPDVWHPGEVQPEWSLWYEERKRDLNL